MTTSRLQRLALYRRLSQIFALILFSAAPYLHLIRIETDAGIIYWFGRAMPLGMTLHTDAPVVLLLFIAFWIPFIFFLLSLSFLMEKAFCAFLCPGNTMPELADLTIRYFTGKRYGGDRYPHGKRPERTFFKSFLHIGGWLLLLTWLTFAMQSYFFSAGGIIHGLISAHGLAFWFFLGNFALLTIWIFWVRHKFCPWCPFGVFYQWVFGYITGAIKFSLPSWGDSYRIRFLKERADTCVHCNLCERVCPTNVSVMVTDGSLSCVSCGMCVEECAKIMERRNLPPVIDYSAVAQRHRVSSNIADTFPWGRRAVAALVLLTVSAVFITSPLYLFAPYPVELLSYTGRVTPSGSSFNYVISITNDTLQATSFRVTADQLPADVSSLRFSPRTLTLRSLQQENVLISAYIPNKRPHFTLAPGKFEVLVYAGTASNPIARQTVLLAASHSFR